MSAGQPFNNQFLPHSGPRGPTVPPGMNPANMLNASGMSPMNINTARAPAMSALYAGQRMPQHGYPTPPQGQQIPRQSVKRTYSSEVCIKGGRVLELKLWSLKLQPASFAKECQFSPSECCSIVLSF